MKTLQTVVFILAVFVLATQAVRHVYVRFIEPRSSVLDVYDQTETQKAIRSAGSLDELLAQYDTARKQKDALDDELLGMEEGKTLDEIEVLRGRFRVDHEEAYQRECDLREAISTWEEKSKEVLKLRFFWAVGFALLLAGALLQFRGPGWVGMALILPGVTQMIWWTSPSFRFAGSPVEFDRLLMNKLAFTLVTLAILLGWWAFTRRTATT